MHNHTTHPQAEFSPFFSGTHFGTGGVQYRVSANDFSESSCKRRSQNPLHLFVRLSFEIFQIDIPSILCISQLLVGPFFLKILKQFNHFCSFSAYQKTLPPHSKHQNLLKHPRTGGEIPKIREKFIAQNFIIFNFFLIQLSKER
ncbi:MAG: hypothetical protein R2874_12305 [Desulfobacterales bacterium]